MTDIPKRRVEIMRCRKSVCIIWLASLIAFTLACCSLSDELYDVDSSGTDIKYVLEALARRSGANIVVSPEVTGNVSAHLKQMTIDAILDHMSAVQGFAWEKKDGAYLVASKEKLAKPVPEQAPVPENQVLVWQCKNAKPADLVTVLTKLMPNLKAVEGPSQITPVLSSGSSGSSYTGGESSSSSSTTTSETTSTSNACSLIIMGSPVDIARARDILTQLDIPRKQVKIDVAITEITNSKEKNIGTEWSWGDINLTEDTTTSGIWFGKFTKDATNVAATVSALVSSGRANLLAQPNISVLDNESAEILIGDRILFPKLTGYSDNGVPIYDKDEEKVGIYLQIAPKITGESEVVLTLYPQVSLVTGYLNNYPQISTREAKTTVSVKNGATLAIGGLVQENEIRDASKVPLLGDLPIIGSIFRHSKTTKDRTEIVIFLTPKIVEET